MSSFNYISSAWAVFSVFSCVVLGVKRWLSVFFCFFKLWHWRYAVFFPEQRVQQEVLENYKSWYSQFIHYLLLLWQVGFFSCYVTTLICRNVILQRFMSLEESKGHSIQNPENKCWIFWSCVWDLSHLCFCCYGNPSTCFWLFIIYSALWISYAKIYFDWQRWFDRITLWVVYQNVWGEKSI